MGKDAANFCVISDDCHWSGEHSIFCPNHPFHVAKRALADAIRKEIERLVDWILRVVPIRRRA